MRTGTHQGRREDRRETRGLNLPAAVCHGVGICPRSLVQWLAVMQRETWDVEQQVR